MSFQRSYSKVWWGSDSNQMPNAVAPAAATTSSNIAGSSFTSGGFYSYYSQQQQPFQQQMNFSSTSTGTSGSNRSGNGGNGSDFHSLDTHGYKSYAVNLSCIQEVDDEQNSSKLSWLKHDSPGSLRSQDSGFSDNDESHSTRSLSGRSTKQQQHRTPPSPSSKSLNSNSSSNTSSASPKSTRSVATPPTVVRRVGNSAFYSPLVSVTRRISFSTPNKTLTDDTLATATASESEANGSQPGNDEVDENTSKLFAQLDSMQLSNGTPKKSKYAETLQNGVALPATPPQPAARRRRRVTRKLTRSAVPENNNDNDNDNDVTELSETEEAGSVMSGHDNVPAYNNETVYLGEAPPPYNNETVVLGGVQNETIQPNPDDNDDYNNNSLQLDLSPLRSRFTANTSTPNAKSVQSKVRPQYDGTRPIDDLSNPLLKSQLNCVQSWIRDLRYNCDQEVMSTLQTKSIAQEAFKNFTITTSSVAKLIRQLQQRALELQGDFERLERILSGSQTATLHDALNSAESLVSHVGDFTKVLERRIVFFTESRAERRKYEENLEQIRIITKDTCYSLERQHYINVESLLDDVQVLKRYLLITIRLIFERMVHVIVQSIEQSRCDMLLRANINMIATLTNIDYDGFASLTDAFVQNEAVRALLVIVLDHKLTSVRAMALRALATICCAPEAIAQLGVCGGIEIVRDILQHPASEAEQRGNIERREAVSLLAQITASWHGPDHRVDGLKDCAESLVAGIAALITTDCCSQTLLLCAATLNNLSRMEITAHYSIMSNEAIFKLIASADTQQTCTSVFLHEQIVAMLHNMSLNKKCHSHLANGIIINFITSVYQTEFYKKYNSRAESDAQRRCIKAILHTLTRLVQDSNGAMGAELMEQWQNIPEFYMLTNMTTTTAVGATAATTLDNSHGYTRDVSQLARQLLHAHHKEQIMLQAASGGGSGSGRGIRNGTQLPEGQTSRGSGTVSPAPASPASALKFNLTRQESFV